MASSDIVLSAALRNNLLSLQGTQSLIDKVQLRLATGLKVNSALDGPSQFFTSQSLTNRAGDLGRLLDGINLSIRTIEEADKGVTALTSLVEQAQAVAEDAKSAALAQSGFVTIRSTKDLSGVADLVAGSGGSIVTGDQINIIVKRDGVAAALTSGNITITSGDTIYDLVGTINSIAAINPYVRASVDASGHFKLTSLEEGAQIRIQDGPTVANTFGADGYAYLGLDNYVKTEDTNATATGTRQGSTVLTTRELRSQAALAATAVNGVYQSSATLAAAGFAQNFATVTTDDFFIDVTVNGVTTTLGNGGGAGYLTADNGAQNAATVQDIIDDINTVAGITASFDTTTGQIVLTADDDTTSLGIDFYSNDATSTGDFAWGFGTGLSSGYGALGGATDVTLLGAGGNTEEFFTFISSAADLSQFETDYNNIRSQIDNLVEDANFRGVNLLGGDDLTTFFNEDRSNTLVTSGVDFTSAGLGLAVADFRNSTSVQTSIDATIEALDSVRNFGQSIANSLSILQTRSDFTQSTINTLKAGAGDLVNADQNEEGANLLALQTRQQLGVTALSLAAQSQQSVLRLF